MESAREPVRARHSRLIVRAESSTSRLAEPLLILEFAPSSLRSCLRRNFRIDRSALVNPGGIASTLGKPVLVGNCGFLANLQMQQCSREPAGTGDLTFV